MTKQDLVDVISAETGISKRDLAQWIGTHHSILSRYLAGTRSLPLKAVQQLLFLHQQMADLPPLTDTVPAEENRDNWLQQAAQCREKQKALQTRYNAMQQNRRSAQKAQQLLVALASDTIMLNPKKLRWIEEQRYQAEKMLIENSVTAQQELAVQIALLQKEKELWEGLVAEQGKAAQD